MPHGMHVLNANARMYYENSVRLNKTKIRWKGFVLFLIYHKFHYYNVWFLTLQLLGYEPADLTVHPPQNCRGWVHFFRIGV